MISLLEIIGIFALLLGVTGVILNNRKLRLCFIVWVIGNAMSAIVHVSTGVESLLVRDVVFTLLCIEGWFKWGKKAKEKNELE